jgi:hypothetical protein
MVINNPLINLDKKSNSKRHLKLKTIINFIERKKILFNIGCLVILIAGTTFWAFNLIGSAQSYRSPLADTPPIPGSTTGSPLTRRVILVLIDALRYDTSTSLTVMPNLNLLRLHGASAVMHSQPPSFSAPGWTTILTGAWPEINDSQLLNPPDEFSARTFTQDNIFSSAQRAGLQTAVSGYVWFRDMLENSGVDSAFYTIGEDHSADTAIVDAALPWLTDSHQLILIFMNQVDYAGHYEGGPQGSNWNNAATKVDILLGKIMANLDLNKDTILVVSDHGQIDRGGHGGPESISLLEPFILAGAGVIPGDYGDIDMVDLSPTMAALLGTNIPSSSQGKVLVEMLTLTRSQQEIIQVSLKVQQAELLDAYSKAIGVTTYLKEGDVVSSTQDAMRRVRLIRLSTERIWRNVLSVFLAVLPAYYLFLHKKKNYWWFLASAGIYLVFFNLRYLILDGLSYSLSSFNQGATFLIIYMASTAAISFIPAWLVPMVGLRSFSNGASKAAETTLVDTWFILYLLSLPVLLNFANNGFIISWTVPNWETLFMGLIFLIQILIVSIIGLLLTAIASGIGRLVHRRS